MTPMTHTTRWLPIALVGAGLLLACGDDGAAVDAGAAADAGDRPDGGRDAGGRDAGSVEDAGPADAGREASDAGADAGVETDGGDDAGAADAGRADAGRRDAGPGGGCGRLGEACFPGADCGPGLECVDGIACVPPGRGTCGGFVGAPCPSDGPPVCTYFPRADYGPCLTVEEAACACARGFGCFDS